MATNPWHILTLEMDATSEMVGKHIRKNFSVHSPQQITVPDHLRITRDGLIDIVESAIPASIKESAQPTLTLYGHGLYHHYTYGLCKVLADRRSDDYCYIHIDQHHDMWNDEPAKYSEYNLDCGRFTRSLLHGTHASSLLLLGICQTTCRIQKGIYYSSAESIGSTGGLRNLQRKFGKISSDVYVSIDLDVLTKEAMSTGWPDGKVSLDTLTQVVDAIASEKNIIGMDILGWSCGTNHRGSGVVEKPSSSRGRRSLKVYDALVSYMLG